MEKTDITKTVISAQNGDKQAFEVLYNEYAKSIHFLALKMMKNTEDAEDLTQDVFLTAFQKIGELKTPESFRSWLGRIAENKCVDALKKRNMLTVSGAEEKAEIEFIEETDRSLIPDKSLDNAETARIIIEIIDKLPLPQRVCVYYYYYENLSVAEIAKQLAVQETTVKNRLALARDKIRKELEQLEDKEGLKLYMATPLILIPLLKITMENTEVPAQVFGKISEALNITASATTATATAATATTATATTATATTVTASAISTKVIAAVIAGIVVVCGTVTAVILGNLGNDAETVIAEAPDITTATTASAEIIISEETIISAGEPPITTSTTPAETTTIDITTSPPIETTEEAIITELSETQVQTIITPPTETANSPAITTATTTTAATTTRPVTTTTRPVTTTPQITTQARTPIPDGLVFHQIVSFSEPVLPFVFNDTIAREALNYINAERTANGLSTLTWSNTLADTAKTMLTEETEHHIARHNNDRIASPAQFTLPYFSSGQISSYWSSSLSYGARFSVGNSDAIFNRDMMGFTYNGVVHFITRDALSNHATFEDLLYNDVINIYDIDYTAKMAVEWGMTHRSDGESSIRNGMILRNGFKTLGVACGDLRYYAEGRYIGSARFFYFVFN
jgi:RNA polymerase sigma factor (sigma-70 family)